jgi:transcriptional regulatory protein LevR
MKFDVTLTTVLVFLVPGIVALLSIAVIACELNQHELFGYLKILSTERILLLAIGSFICGTFVDSIRYFSVDSLFSLLGLHPLKNDSANKSYVEKITTEDKLTIFSYLNERTTEYYRLNSNLMLATLLCFIAQCSQHWPCTYRWYTALLVIALGFATYLNHRDKNNITNLFTKQP